MSGVRYSRKMDGERRLDTLTTIGENAFFDCKSLVTVTLGSSLKTISMHAFYQSKQLEKITIPAGVTSIGVWAFHNCFELGHIKYEGTVAELSAAVKTNYLGDYIPNYVTCSDGSFKLPPRPF